MDIFIESIDNDDDDLRINIKKLFFIFTGTLSQVPLPVIVICAGSLFPVRWPCMGGVFGASCLTPSWILSPHRHDNDCDIKFIINFFCKKNPGTAIDDGHLRKDDTHKARRAKMEHCSIDAFVFTSALERYREY